MINPQLSQDTQHWVGEINGQPAGAILVVGPPPPPARAERVRNTLRKTVGQAAQTREPRLFEPDSNAASRRLNERLAMVSHELRNSLGVIRNVTGLMRITPDESPVATKARLIVERQVSQMARLIGELLEVSQITNGRLSLQSEPVDLCEVVRHAVEGIELEIGRRGQRLTVDLPEVPIWLEGDPRRLEQVLINLLGNAAKYTAVQGEVHLSVEAAGHQATIRVRDSGIGIAAGVLPHIFEPFMQAESSLGPAAGIGIGLALVSNVVELHGGEVSAASAGLGRGSEFTVHLPIL